MKPIACALTLAGALTFAGQAHAAPVASVARATLVERVAVAGDAAVYVDQVGAHRQQLIRVDRSGARKVLKTIPNADRYVTALAASSTRLAYVLGDGNDGAELYTGPLSGPFTAVKTAATPRQIAVSGDNVAIEERDGADGPDNANTGFVQVLAPGATVRTIVSGAADQRPLLLGFAGRFLAVRQVGPRILDWQTGTAAYEPPFMSPAFTADQGRIQDDGTFAFAGGNGYGFASPAEPGGHAVPGVFGAILGVADGRMLVRRTPDEEGTTMLALSIGTSTGALYDATTPNITQDAALSGSTLAYATQRCVYLGDVPAAAPEHAPTGACPQNEPLLSARRLTPGALKLSVLCQAAPGDTCSGRIVVTGRTRTGKAVRLGAVGYRAAGTHGQALALKINPAAYKLLARRGPRPVAQVTATTSDHFTVQTQTQP